jgi:redox-sensitive bicupin YhaK (pirin superfamily)
MRPPTRLAQTLGKAFRLPPLGRSWPGPGPFLYVMYHRDTYPAGNGALAPDPALLAGRVLGNDFSHRDGWSMYMGSAVPGFPAHPHRGMETVTIVREGTIDHGDSTASGARYSVGDVQWVTAGRGVVHSEMFPLLHTEKENPLDMYQLWLNLAAADKDAEPEFVMMWREAIPHVQEGGATVQVIAGAWHGAAPLPPPKRSWAARADADVGAWFIDMQPGSKVSLPPTNTPETERTVYVHACAPGPAGPEAAEEPVAVRVGDEVVPDWHAVSLPPGSRACRSGSPSPCAGRSS